jgi:hypothetical protein
MCPAPGSCRVRSVPAAFRYPLSRSVKCLLSLKRREGARLPAGTGPVTGRLVEVRLAHQGTYRSVHARCCVGGSDVAVLWEPVLVKIDARAIRLQGFEASGGQTVAQEWELEPYVATPGR